MARGGRRPKPDEAHRRDGTRRRGQGQAETPNLVGGRGEPERPTFPDAEFRKVWDETVELLLEGNVIDKADGSVIEAFTTALVTARRARKVIADRRAALREAFGFETYGLVETGQKSAAVVSPFVTIERNAMKDVSSLADQLGLGPAGRARLGIAKRGSGDQSSGRKHNDDARSRGVPDSPRARRAGLGVVQGGRG